MLPNLKKTFATCPSQFALEFIFFNIQTGDLKRLPPDICLETHSMKKTSV